LRASDADRETVVDRLREAAGEGRLEPDEFEQRVDGVLRARTYGDLARFLADLPAEGRRRSPGSRRPTSPLARSAVLAAGVVVAATAAVAVVLVVAMLVLAAAALWVAVVVCWLICRGLGRRLVGTPPGRRSMGRRSMGARRVRPTGSL
jgi:Domain of unknown function (DUF1707)